MKGIKFTHGTVIKFDNELFELTLFNNDKQVYSGHIDLDMFMRLTSVHKSIKIIVG